MTPLPTTALIATIALALPALTTPVLPRQDYPQPLGLEPGDKYSADLTFITYAETSCNGEGHVFNNSGAGYGYYAAWQMQSYHLSRDLQNNERLDFFTGFGTGLQSKYSVDHAMDGHYTLSCLLYDATAGNNATTNDGKKHNGDNVGCHTLLNNEWCANIYTTGVE